MLNIVRHDGLKEKPPEEIARGAEDDSEPETSHEPVEAPKPIEEEEP